MTGIKRQNRFRFEAAILPYRFVSRRLLCRLDVKAGLLKRYTRGKMENDEMHMSFSKKHGIAVGVNNLLVKSLLKDNISMVKRRFK